MNTKIRQLFNPIQNGMYEYKGENTLVLGQGKQIIVGQYVDLSECNLLSAFKDDATLNLQLKDDTLYYIGHSS